MQHPQHMQAVSQRIQLLDLMLNACRQLMAEYQQNLAAKVFEPYRPRSLADQVRDLRAMVVEAHRQQQISGVPSFLSRAHELQHGAEMDLEEEEQACQRALEHILEMADAGKHMILLRTGHAMLSSDDADSCL